MSSYSCDRLVLHIHWIISKPPEPGWSDIRQNTFGHTLYWIHEGKGVFSSGGIDYAIESGTLVYLHPELPLFMRADERIPLRMTMVLFECAAYRHEGPGSGWALEPVGRLGLPFIRRFAPVRAKELGKRFLEAESLWVPGNAVKEALAKSLLLRLLADMHQTTETEGRLERNERSMAESLLQAKDYI